MSFNGTVKPGPGRETAAATIAPVIPPMITGTPGSRIGGTVLARCNRQET